MALAVEVLPVADRAARNAEDGRDYVIPKALAEQICSIYLDLWPIYEIPHSLIVMDLVDL